MPVLRRRTWLADPSPGWNRSRSTSPRLCCGPERRSETHATIAGNGSHATYGDGGVGAQARFGSLTPTNSKVQGTSYQGEGARLTYRYVDGVLTNQPLWPWPMESRGAAEMGLSITLHYRARPEIEG